ncbi:MAG: NTP transferase domain-containing protein [Gemmatimonadaceae bacterium]|nr:NTP transferase domain-containing protein [Gemmatimonadaceae bacterium]
MRTTQAVILARGLGSRMWRAEAAVALDEAQERAAAAGHKGMMPTLGRPFLDFVLSALADAGVRDVTLVVAPDHAMMRDYYARQVPPERVRLRWAVQAEPRGTADAVLAAADVVDDAPFLALNSDNYYPVASYDALCSLGGAGLVAYEGEALVREGNIDRERVMAYALLDIDDAGLLRGIVEKPPADHPLAQRAERWVSMNLWSFTPRIFDACRRVQPSVRGELELQDAVMIATRELGERFHVVRAHAGVLDLSRRADVASIGEHLRGIEVRP